MERKAWSEEELDYLKKESGSSSWSDIAKHLDRSYGVVQNKAYSLGLKGRGRVGVPHSVATPDGLEYLRSRARVVPVSELAATLSLSEKQVRQLLHHYKIEGRGQSREHTEAENEAKRERQRAATLEKYPPAGPWSCVNCKLEKPLSEFYTDTKSHECRTCQRNGHIMRNYGLTAEDYDRMLEQQGGVCAICHNPERRVTKEGVPFSLAVDHDHSCCPGTKTCGKCIRGLLCWECNNVIGKIERLVGAGATLEAFAGYLRGR